MSSGFSRVPSGLLRAVALALRPWHFPRTTPGHRPNEKD